MPAATVLIVDDDPAVRGFVRTLLERAGKRVAEAPDGLAGLRAFYASQPDLVVLDVGLPKLDGWQVLERIRELSEVPVLMLTASGGELDKVRGLRGGADDYLTKPFSHEELLARVEAILRRMPSAPQAREVYSDELLEVDFGQRRVIARGTELRLTPTEFRLLAAFVRNPDQVLSRDQLLEIAWGGASGRSREQVKLYVGYLRRKLRSSAGVEPIETVRGFGYRYRPGADA
jgi:DNA-binding response OmpR family regulator